MPVVARGAGLALGASFVAPLALAVVLAPASDGAAFALLWPLEAVVAALRAVVCACLVATSFTASSLALAAEGLATAALGAAVIAFAPSLATTLLLPVPGFAVGAFAVAGLAASGFAVELAFAALLGFAVS